jgi:succinoglycan biosynthesis protein ExoA
MNAGAPLPIQVSVVMPVFNEERHLGATLAALARQTYPREQLEVLVVDGRSTDATRTVVRTFAEHHPKLRLVLLDNPERIIPCGMNLGIRAARGEIIVRMDGHTIPADDYVESCVAALERAEADVVGGCISPHGDTPFSRAVAVAQVTRLGAGDAAFHHATTPGFVDTVYLGAFRRHVLERVGLYDPGLLRNEDYELAVRSRRAGFRLYLDPNIRSRYTPRGTPLALAHQYAAYGWWKVETLRRHPTSLRWRQAVPALFVATLLLSLLLAPFSRWGAGSLAALLIAYLGAHALAAVAMARTRRYPAAGANRLLVHAAIAIIHLCWGAGFLLNLVTLGSLPRRAERVRIPELAKHHPGTPATPTLPD